MLLQRPARTRLAFVFVAAAFLIAGLIGGDMSDSLPVVAVVAVAYGGAEFARRRGSYVAAEIVGRGDERSDHVGRDVAFRTVNTLVGVVLGYQLYTIATGASDERYSPAITLFIAAWLLNYLWVKVVAERLGRGATSIT